MQEGSTWEAAMSASHFRLDGLVALVDCNGIQADGPVVLDMEPVADKWRAFGWEIFEIDGNDMSAVVGALACWRAQRTASRRRSSCARLPGKGVPRIETSEKSHFFRVDVREWDGIIAEFEQSVGARAMSAPAKRAARSPWAQDERRQRPADRRRAVRPGPQARSATKRPEIVGLTADLGKYTDILPFRDAFPRPLLQCRHGRAEPRRGRGRAGAHRADAFATTYGVFATPPRLRFRRHRAARTRTST